MTVRVGTNRSPKTIIAAATQVRLNRTQRIGEPWQEKLWDIYEQLGPVHYGMTFKRSAAQRVDYFAAERIEDQSEPIPTENTEVIEALDQLGDISQIVGDFVVQENVAGEGYLHQTDDDELEEDPYEVLSTLEVKRRQTATENPIGEDDWLLRIWRRSPADSTKPDSPLRSVQAQCEQLLLLNDEIGATAMSRIPAGLLFLASEFSLPGPATDPPTEGAEISDPFMAEIIEIATQAISDPDSAARVAPNVIRAPAELIEKGVKYIDFGRAMNETFAAMREELLRQIAGGINLPAEILTGLADLNHWSLWGVDESTAKHHVDPDVLHILSGLTQGYLWPTLQTMGIADPRRYLIWRDYSDLTSRPLTIEQAERLFDKSVITAQELKGIVNIADADSEISAGDVAARAEAVGILFRAGFEPQAILDALDVPAITHTGAVPVTVQSEDEIEDTTSPAGPDNVDRNPPDTLIAATPVTLTTLARIDAVTAAKITEAAEAAFSRALERAGVRVRNKAKKNREVTALLSNVKNDEVTRHLGMDRLEQLQMTADELLPRGTFDGLVERLDDLITEAQTQTRTELSNIFSEVVPERHEEAEDRSSAIDAFIAALFIAATARLFTDSPAPDPAEEGEFGTEIATGEMVFELLTRAGGSEVIRFDPDTPRGLALGARTRALLRDHGFRVESETWDWAYWRVPLNPFEPHVSLDGFTTIDRHDPRLNGRYPGDHRFCTCNWVPAVLPADG